MPPKAKGGRRLEGFVIVVTGEIAGMTRLEFAAKLTAAGAKLGTGVTGNTTHVLVGTAPGASKLEDAERQRADPKRKDRPLVIQDAGLFVSQYGLGAVAPKTAAAKSAVAVGVKRSPSEILASLAPDVAAFKAARAASSSAGRKRTPAEILSALAPDVVAVKASRAAAAAAAASVSAVAAPAASVGSKGKKSPVPAPTAAKKRTPAEILASLAPDVVAVKAARAAVPPVAAKGSNAAKKPVVAAAAAAGRKRTPAEIIAALAPDVVAVKAARMKAAAAVIDESEDEVGDGDDSVKSSVGGDACEDEDGDDYDEGDDDDEGAAAGAGAAVPAAKPGRPLPSAFDFTNDYGSGLAPRSALELRMIAASQEIRRKPGWRLKLAQPAVAGRWQKELAQQGLEPSAVDYVMHELRWYATLLPAPLAPGPVDGTYEADGLLPDALCSALRRGIDAVKAAGPPDWHPGSHGQVLDIVHPSLYPGVRGVSVLTASGAVWPTLPAKPPPPPGLEWRGGDPRDKYASRTYQWLPAEFELSAAGGVHIASPVNNLLPCAEHVELHGALAGAFARFVPLFELALRDLAAPRPPRIPVASVSAEEEEEEEASEEDSDASRKPQMLPAPAPPFSPPALAAPASLWGRTLQVIVKLAEIVLTPDAPEYPGGVWHVEGMMNEHIVATGIHYLTMDNVAESRLQFRQAVCEPEYEQNDNAGVELVYGLTNDDELNQPLGHVVARQGLSLAFPNTYQHCVAPFRLADAARPGRRTIVVFFLVDPAVRVTSTADVRPQQAAWYSRSPLAAAALHRLPPELRDRVGEFAAGMSRAGAEAHRAALMAERSKVVGATGEVFTRPFSLCEH